MFNSLSFPFPLSASRPVQQVQFWLTLVLGFLNRKTPSTSPSLARGGGGGGRSKLRPKELLSGETSWRWLPSCGGIRWSRKTDRRKLSIYQRPRERQQALPQIFHLLLQSLSCLMSRRPCLMPLRLKWSCSRQACPARPPGICSTAPSWTESLP